RAQPLHVLPEVEAAALASAGHAPEQPTADVGVEGGQADVQRPCRLAGAQQRGRGHRSVNTLTIESTLINPCLGAHTISMKTMDGREERGAAASGLEGVEVARTALSHVDGEAGRLIVGGHDLEELAGHGAFEDVCLLLWDGRLPDPAA